MVLGITGVFAAVVLWFVAKKFHVNEDPRIAEIEALLPGANCGSCGQSGCHAFAVACAKPTSLDDLNCPGAGPEAMEKIADICGLKAVASVEKVAVVHCAGSCEVRKRTNVYNGVRSCAIEASLYVGETDCQYGCLGCGDCVKACPFDSIHINAETALPEVNFDTCVGCGRCVDACPRGVISLMEKTPDKPLVWVACRNHDRGPVAMKECGVSCIGCTKCVKVCPTGAPSMDRFLSTIEQEKCIGCGECIAACPRHCIISHGELKPVVKETSEGE